MKQKPTFKSILVVASFFSLFAFVFVNWQSGFTSIKPVVGKEFVAANLKEEDETEERKVALPDVTVLGRLWEIAQHLIDRKN